MREELLIERDDLVLIDIEGIEQFLDVPAFGGYYFPRKRVPHNRYLLEEFHEVVELDVSSAFGQDEPAEARLLEVSALEYHLQVIGVVLFSDEAIVVAIDEVEDPADEGILSSEQSKSSPELLIVHAFSVLAEVVESMRDDEFLLVVEGEVVDGLL